MSAGWLDYSVKADIARGEILEPNADTETKGVNSKQYLISP